MTTTNPISFFEERSSKIYQNKLVSLDEIETKKAEIKNIFVYKNLLLQKNSILKCKIKEAFEKEKKLSKDYKNNKLKNMELKSRCLKIEKTLDVFERRISVPVQLFDEKSEIERLKNKLSNQKQKFHEICSFSDSKFPSKNQTSSILNSKISHKADNDLLKILNSEKLFGSKKDFRSYLDLKS